MSVLENTNGKIKGIKFDINNNIKLFLSDGDVVDICLKNTTEDDFIKRIRKIDENILIEQAAGITNGEQVYDFIMAGSEAAGAASGIMNANEPIAMIDEMICAVRRAVDDLKKRG